MVPENFAWIERLPFSVDLPEGGRGWGEVDSECRSDMYARRRLFLKTLKNAQIADEIPKKYRVSHPFAKRHALVNLNNLITVWGTIFFPVKNFLETFCFYPKKYKNFISAQNFPEDPKKIPKSEFYTLKNTTSIPITLLWECPPGDLSGKGKCL